MTPTVALFGGAEAFRGYECGGALDLGANPEKLLAALRV